MKRKVQVIVLLLTLLVHGCGSLTPTVKLESHKTVQVLKPTKPVLRSIKHEGQSFVMSRDDSIRLLQYIKELERAFDECAGFK